jgi:uncharacterized protein YxjI
MRVRLFIKQKVFSWNDRFTVRDENETDRYFVEGEIFSFGHHLHIYDASHNEVAYIQQKFLSFKPRYYIFKNGSQVAEFVKDFTLFKQKYSFGGLPWSIGGEFTRHDYSLSDVTYGSIIMTVSKQWFTWGDSYLLDIADGADEILCLAAVIAIDCANEDASHNNGSF